MLVKELISRIDTKDTPIFFHEIPLPNHDYCYAITIAASELAVLRKRPSSGIKDEELGVHLVNDELQEVYDSYCQRNPVAVNETCSMLFERCSVPAEKKVYAYVLFTILHEIGHWKHLIQSGLSSMDYWKKYEAGRDFIWMDFQCEYFVCKNDIQRQKTLARFNEKYRNLPSERFADEYAIRELSQYL